MCDIDHECGIILMTECLEGSDVGYIAVHRKQRFRHDKNPCLRFRRAKPLQPSFDRGRGKMRNGMHIPRGVPSAFLETGMSQDVNNDMISPGDKCLDDAITRRPANRE